MASRKAHGALHFTPGCHKVTGGIAMYRMKVQKMPANVSPAWPCLRLGRFSARLRRPLRHLRWHRSSRQEPGGYTGSRRRGKGPNRKLVRSLTVAARSAAVAARSAAVTQNFPNGMASKLVID